MNGFIAILKRDLHLATRHGLENMMVVMFFVIAVVMFPFGVGPEPNILARIAAGVIWVAALLASMLSLERLLKSAGESGSPLVDYRPSVDPCGTSVGSAAQHER